MAVLPDAVSPETGPGEMAFVRGLGEHASQATLRALLERDNALLSGLAAVVWIDWIDPAWTRVYSRTFDVVEPSFIR